MSYLMGIDLGTSSLKVIIMDTDGKVVAQASRSYGITSAGTDQMEQSPDIWWQACCESIQECTAVSGKYAEQISGIGFSGQMHGLVTLDKNLTPLRPAIIHCDGRSSDQVQRIQNKLGADSIQTHLMNPIFTGFQLASLLWLQEHEAELFEKIHVILSPKDYLRLKLTGEAATDISDASATLLFDVKKLCWWVEALDMLGIPKHILPAVLKTTDVAGSVTAGAASLTGLRAGTIVSAGGGDQCMQAVGNGVVSPVSATITIGTSGQIFMPTHSPILNPAMNTHTFCSAQQGVWFIMGAMLSAGISLKWFQQLVGNQNFSELDAMARTVPPGGSGLLFLPYLNGERTPHMDKNLRGALLGMTLQTGLGEAASAIMEGVTFALRECLETCLEFAPEPQRFIASGGGAHSAQWLQIQADIFNRPLYISTVREHASVGAAIAAGVAAGEYDTLEQGCRAVVRYRPEPVLPSAKSAAVYDEYYKLFLEVGAANRKVLQSLARIARLTNT